MCGIIDIDGDYMKKGMITKILGIIVLIIMILCLWLKLDWLLILATIITAICVILTFVLKDK